LIHPLLRRAAAGLLPVLLLAACALPAQQAEFLAPNPNLVVRDAPPVPMSLVRAVEKYTDFRGHGFLDWHPEKREMLLTHRPAGASTTQLFRLAAPMGQLEQLTDGADPVMRASYEPLHGRYLVFARGSGGNEANQLYRLDLDSRKISLLTDPDERHEHMGWLHRQSMAIVGSVPLDRTAKGGSRATVNTTLWLMDPERPAQKKKLAELPGPGWFGGSVSWDDRRLALTRYLSANESQVWLLDLASGERKQLLPREGETQKAAYYAESFKRDDSGLFVVSDQASEFREMMYYDFGKALLTRITSHIPWDVSGGTATEDGRLIALQANVEGRDELRLFDGNTFRELPRPALPGGSVGATRFHKHLPDLVFTLNSARGPSEIFSLDPQSGKVEQWTRAYSPPGLDPKQFSEQQIVRWKSFDGREISGLISRPPARFTGRRPVLIVIHGGPEGQATIGFLARYQYFIQELGITLIQPNVRGSTGFGKTFLALDNGRLRENSVKDIGALLGWIATQPDLDSARVMVSGGSYGGYMSLAVATHYSERIAGAIDVVGISHFVTFLESTESYRRDLRRVEYGDERDPEMRAFLDRISPLSNAQKIKKPLLVVQGKNDPRVPYTEAEQIVAKVKAGGVPVWYLRAENEGHGFARKENADYQLYTTVLFLKETLLR